jgi:type I restriction enzyme S subunit
MNTNKNNKDKDGHMDEKDLGNQFREILIKKYHYSPDQISSDFLLDKDGEKIKPDLVVLDEKKNPAIIVEIKSGKSILPIFEYQLKDTMITSKANFGIFYNGKIIQAYKLEDGFLIKLDDVPRKTRGMRMDEIIERSKAFAKPEVQIWHLADIARGRYGSYESALVTLCLKIIDERKNNGALCKLITEEKSADAFDKLMSIGKEHFPDIFSRFHDDESSRELIVMGLHTLDNFFINDVDKEIMTKAILKMTQYKEGTDFPKEISEFIVELLDIDRSEKTFLPYCGFGNFSQIIQAIESSNRLNGEKLGTKYDNNLTGSEINLRQIEIIKLISLLHGKSFNVIQGEFVEVEPNIISQQDNFLAFPPIGSEMYYERAKDQLGDYGRSLDSYAILKIIKFGKSGAKAAILTTQGFFLSNRYQRIREQIIRSGYLRGIIQFPDELLFPATGIMTALLILEISDKRDQNEIFFADLTSSKMERKKFDHNTLQKTIINFHRYMRNDIFREDSVNFLVEINETDKTWTFADKTPEYKSLIKKLHGIKLAEVAEIYFGKPKPIDDEPDGKRIPYILTNNIIEGKIENVENTISLPTWRSNEYSTITLQENDILIVCQGIIGRIALVEPKYSGTIPSPQLAIIRANKHKILPEFLFLALQSEQVTLQVRSKIIGSFIHRIPRNELNNIIVPFPPLKKQHELISEFHTNLEEIRQLETQLMKKKQRLQQLHSFEIGE